MITVIYVLLVKGHFALVPVTSVIAAEFKESGECRIALVDGGSLNPLNCKDVETALRGKTK